MKPQESLFFPEQFVVAAREQPVRDRFNRAVYSVIEGCKRNTATDDIHTVSHASLEALVQGSAEFLAAKEVVEPALGDRQRAILDSMTGPDGQFVRLARMYHDSFQIQLDGDAAPTRGNSFFGLYGLKVPYEGRGQRFSARPPRMAYEVLRLVNLPENNNGILPDDERGLYIARNVTYPDEVVTFKIVDNPEFQQNNGIISEHRFVPQALTPEEETLTLKELELASQAYEHDAATSLS